MIEIIVQPTGDRAEAESWAAARVAARTLLREARQEGCSRPTATYVLNGVLVPEGAVSASETGGKS